MFVLHMIIDTAETYDIWTPLNVLKGAVVSLAWGSSRFLGNIE